MMNLGFSLMIQKPSILVPRFGKLQLHRQLQNSNEQIEFQSNDDCIFLYSMDLYRHWVSKDQTINQNYLLEDFAKLRGKVLKKRSELWKNMSWVFHQDN